MTQPSDLRGFRPLLMSYGGGHAQIIAVLAKELIARGAEPQIIGLTTAARFFERGGLPTQSVLALQGPTTGADATHKAQIAPYIKDQKHPDITSEETEAYFRIGYRDLEASVGSEEAQKQLAMLGRKAFLPVDSLEKFLKESKPDVVVTTSSPRFELAMLQASRRLSIPSLAISDLFLIREREWIIPGPFAEHLSVFAPSVKQDLLQAGLRGTEVHVTGNPAFDSLQKRPSDADKRRELRDVLGIADRTVILWPAAQLGARGRSGDPYAGPEDLVPVFEQVCKADPNFAYILRHHPNSAFTLGSDARNGILDDGSVLTPEDALLVADVVCVEVSTMGLQAALRGIPVICVKYAEDSVYPLHGLARSARDLQEMSRMLLLREFGPPKQTFDMPVIGEATRNVADLVVSLRQC